MDSYYEQELNKLLLKAAKIGEVPVAALLVMNGKIVSKAYNKRISTNNPLLHAEVQCIIKASKKLKDWRLDECDLYVSLEPCHMCKEIIKECRIRNVYFYTKNTKSINFKTSFNYIDNSFSESYKHFLSNFFKYLR